MFLELTEPKVIDLQSTRDRTKVRIGEDLSQGRFWLNLTFYSEEHAVAFFEACLAKLRAPRPLE